MKRHYRVKVTTYGTQERTARVLAVSRRRALELATDDWHWVSSTIEKDVISEVLEVGDATAEKEDFLEASRDPWKLPAMVVFCIDKDMVDLNITCTGEGRYAECRTCPCWDCSCWPDTPDDEKVCKYYRVQDCVCGCPGARWLAHDKILAEIHKEREEWVDD